MTSGKPKSLVRPMPHTWWLKRKNYFIFMMRELSSVFVALFAVATVLQVSALKEGPGAYGSFLSALSSPAAILFALIALAFVLLHTVTFFLLAGSVLVIPAGDERVPPRLIVAGHFAAWLVASLLFVLIVL